MTLVYDDNEKIVSLAKCKILIKSFGYSLVRLYHSDELLRNCHTRKYRVYPEYE